MAEWIRVNMIVIAKHLILICRFHSPELQSLIRYIAACDDAMEIQ